MCTTCRQSRAAAEFRLQRRGGTLRRCQCRLCFNEEQRLRRKAKKDRRFQAHLRQLTRRKRGPWALVRLVNAIVIDMGGLQETAELFVAHMTTAPPGSGRAIRTIIAFHELLVVADDIKRGARPVLNMDPGTSKAVPDAPTRAQRVEMSQDTNSWSRSAGA